jgi:two-component system chemotaxis response regulator CheB
MSAQRIRAAAVVIGASAGGLEALSDLLPALPAAFRAPIFVVQHLPRDRPSLIADILASKCVIAVREAEDKLPACPGTVYFAPPDYHLLVDEGHTMALSMDEPVHFSRPSIDVLFESAADAYRSGLVGVILSGASEDGAAGLEAVRRAGGITIAQDPATANVAVMIQAALARGPVDYILSPSRIAERLVTLT